MPRSGLRLSEGVPVDARVESHEPELGEGIVVDQGADLADEEAVAAGDVEVLHLLDLGGGALSAAPHAAEDADLVPGFQVARHGPTPARSPEPVKDAGADLLLADSDVERL